MPRDLGESTGFPSALRRIMPFVVIAVGLFACVSLMFRNEPFRDPILAHGIRIFLAVLAGVAVQVVPGMLRIELSQSGRRITSTGSLAFALLTYMTAPQVAGNLDPTSVPSPPPLLFPMKVWAWGDVTTIEKSPFGPPNTYKTAWVSWMLRKINHEAADGEKLTVVSETRPFTQAYEAFLAKISTVPSKSLRPSGRHEFHVFIVDGTEGRFMFSPVNVIWDQSGNAIAQIPQTKKGQFIFMIAGLRPRQPSMKGERMPILLMPLKN